MTPMPRAVRRLAVPVLLTALALAGCADREDDVAGGIGLSADEAAWVGRFSAWSEQLSAPSTELLWGVWGTGANNIWAVGDSGTILRWNGVKWLVVQ